MLTANPLSRYQAVQVTTCTPGQLLLVVYDGLFRFLGEAEEALRLRDRARAGERISRCHALLEQLLVGLDPAPYPALVETLEPLYLFCMQHLVQANIRQDPALVAEVSRVLAPLREAWREAVTTAAAANTVSAAP